MKNKYEELDEYELDLDASQGVLSKTLRNVGVIAAICVVLAIVLGTNSDSDGDKPEAQTQQSQAAPSAVTEQRAALAQPIVASRTSPSELVIRAGASGHFELTAEINGDLVDFLVDTGASHIILSPDAAEQVGIYLSDADFSQSYQTANGVARAAPVTLRSLRIGELEMYDLEASVMERDMTVSLLGMSFLNRLEGYEVRDRKLVLAW